MPYVKVTNKCRACGRRLAKQHGNAHFCDTECRRIHRLNKQLKTKVSYAKPVCGCALCGQEFNPVNAAHIYCTDACRAIINRRHKPAANPTKPRTVPASWPDRYTHREKTLERMLKRAARRKAVAPKP